MTNQTDKDRENELEKLKSLFTGMKRPTSVEEISPSEARALLRYIDKLEGAEDEEVTVKKTDLQSAMTKLVGIAAGLTVKKTNENQS